MEWRRTFRGRSRLRSMRSCTKQRGPREDRPQSRRVRERPGRAWSRPLQERRKSLQGRGRPGAGRNRTGRLRGRVLKDRGNPHETKSLLEHLIKSIEERLSGWLANGAQAAEDKEYG